MAGTSYYLTDAASGPGAALYQSTISCIDANGVQSGLPFAVFVGSQVVTPVAGSAITCTITSNAVPAVLSLTKTNPVQLIVGTPANYTLTVTNNGGAPATTAEVLDRLPANLEYNSVAGTGWTCSATGSTTTGQLVSCSFTGSITALATSSFTVNVTPLEGAAGSTVEQPRAITALLERFLTEAS